jgi:hypothetical protein
LPEVVQESNSENVNAAPPQTIQASHSQNITENECLRQVLLLRENFHNLHCFFLHDCLRFSHSGNLCFRSSAQDVIGAPSQSQNARSNIDISLVCIDLYIIINVTEVSILHLHAVKLTVYMFPFQAPQQNFCLSDMMTSYSRSHCEYAGGTRSICGNNQWSWPSPPQPTYLPNFTPRPSSFSPGSGITLVKIAMPLICTAILKRFLLLNFFCGENLFALGKF